MGKIVVFFILVERVFHLTEKKFLKNIFKHTCYSAGINKILSFFLGAQVYIDSSAPSNFEEPPTPCSQQLGNLVL